MKAALYLKGKMAFLPILSMVVLSNCTSSKNVIKEERISPSELRDHLSDMEDINKPSTSGTKIRLLELRAGKRGFEVVPEYNYAGKELDNRVYKTVGVAFRDDTGKLHKKEFIQTLSKRWPHVRFVDSTVVHPGASSALLFDVLIEPHSTNRSGLTSLRTTASIRDMETKILLGRLNREIVTDPDSLLEFFVHPECPTELKDPSLKFYLKKTKFAGGEESFGILAIDRNDAILLGMTKGYYYTNGVMGMLGKKSDSDSLRLADSNEGADAIKKRLIRHNVSPGTMERKWAPIFALSVFWV